MKTRTLITLGLASAALSTHAAVVVQESFNYTEGALGTTTSTGLGETGNWGSFAYGAGSIGGSASGVVATGSLAAPSNYGYTPSNNHLSYSATAGSVSNSMVKLATGAVIDFDSDTTYYISFLENHTASGFAFNLQSQLQLRNNVNTTILEIGFFNGSLRANASSAATGSALGNNQDRLLVFRIDASSTGNDIVRGAYFNAGTTIGSEPASWDLTLNTAAIAGSATFFNATLGANAGAGVTHTTRLDEIKFGASFADVTGVPEPSTYALLAGFLTLGLVLLRRRVR